MTGETRPQARRAGGAKHQCESGKPQRTDAIVERIGSEVIVASFATVPEPIEEIERKVADAMNGAESRGAEWITIQRIGLMPANPQRECQELIDRFMIAYAVIESWAHEMGLRIVEAFLRPVDDVSSAVFKLEGGASVPSEAQARVRIDRGGGATTAQRRHRSEWRRGKD